MNARSLALVAVLISASTITADSSAAPPKVIRAVPDNGDVGVAPSTKEIRITFDQDMSEGFSVVGGGDEFPEMLDRPKWENKRTVSVRVKLQPNHPYQLSINNPRFQNFKSVAGEPAEPYPISFRTGDANTPADKSEGKSASNGSTEKENRRAYNLLRTAIRNNYSYRDRLGIDWQKLLQSKEETLVAAKTPIEFAQIAGTLLAKAEDKHIWFKVGDETIPSFVRPAVPNANFKLLPTLVPNWKQHSKQVASGRWDDGIAYLFIGTWDSSDPNHRKTILEALDGMKSTPMLVIDVRGNGGGAEPLAQEVAGCFVRQPSVYGKDVHRDLKSASGFGPVNERRLEPNPNHAHFTDRVAVLTGPVVMSSCESFLLMMKQDPSAVLVGAKSQGSSGNPKPFDLKNGVTVYLPSWKDLTVEGKELEGVGITPDIEVKAVPADFAAVDPVLEAALKYLRSDSK